jgi:transcriptional regulator with XRE-family HTH domain
MGRHQTLDGPTRGRRDGPRWSDPYFCEWSQVVGGRVRRLRLDRGWSLSDLAERVRKPEGGAYTGGYFSRLERGWASAPLYVYLAIAETLEVDPGKLLGEAEVGRETTASERALLGFVEAAGLAPEQAIVRLAGLPGPAPAPARPLRAPYPAQPPDLDDPPPPKPLHAPSSDLGHEDDDHFEEES